MHQFLPTLKKRKLNRFRDEQFAMNNKKRTEMLTMVINRVFGKYLDTRHFINATMVEI